MKNEFILPVVIGLIFLVLALFIIFAYNDSQKSYVVMFKQKTIHQNDLYYFVNDSNNCLQRNPRTEITLLLRNDSFFSKNWPTPNAEDAYRLCEVAVDANGRKTYVKEYSKNESYDGKPYYSGIVLPSTAITITFGNYPVCIYKHYVEYPGVVEDNPYYESQVAEAKSVKSIILIRGNYSCVSSSLADLPQSAIQQVIPILD